MGLVQHPGQEAGRPQQSMGAAHVCHSNLSHGEAEGPDARSESPTDCAARALHCFHLPVGVQLGCGA